MGGRPRHLKLQRLIRAPSPRTARQLFSSARGRQDAKAVVARRPRKAKALGAVGAEAANTMAGRHTGRTVSFLPATCSDLCSRSSSPVELERNACLLQKRKLVCSRCATGLIAAAPIDARTIDARTASEAPGLKILILVIRQRPSVPGQAGLMGWESVRLERDGGCINNLGNINQWAKLPLLLFLFSFRVRACVSEKTKGKESCLSLSRVRVYILHKSG